MSFAAAKTLRPHSAKDGKRAVSPSPLAETYLNTNIYGNHKGYKTPTSAEIAVTVFKKVSEVTGVENIDKGKSAFDKVGHLRTDPAVHLLMKKSWREFFAEVEVSNVDADVNKPSQSHYSNTKEVQDTGNGITAERVNDDDDQLYVRLKSMSRRVHTLWRELRIPDSDRDFYSYSLMSKTNLDKNQLYELAEYIKMLLSCRERTMAVLQAIGIRERCVHNCTERIAWANRRSLLRISPVMTGHSVDADAEDNGEWKTDLRMSLRDLQFATVETVRQIQLWRRGLWRPLPFIYEADNYLVKMATDMEVLNAESMKRLIEILSLQPVDLMCITFQMTAEVGISGDLSTYMDLLSADGEGHADETGRPFTQDLDAVNMIVLQEPLLQQALNLEKKALLTRNVFIPTLKFEQKPSSNM